MTARVASTDATRDGADAGEPVYVRELRFAHIAGTHESYTGDCPLCDDDLAVELASQAAGAFTKGRQLGGGGAVAEAVERAAQAIAAEADRDDDDDGITLRDGDPAPAGKYTLQPATDDDGIKLPVGLPLPAPGDIVMYVLNSGASRGHPRPMMITSVSQNIAAGLPLLAGFVFLEGPDGIENAAGDRMLQAAVRGVRYDDSPATAHQFVEGTWHYREQAFPTFQLLEHGEWARVTTGPETERLPDTEGELPEPRVSLEEREPL